MKLSEKIRSALGAAQQKRSELKGEVPDPVEGTTTFAWVIHEREVVLKIVNEERTLRNLPEIDQKTLAQKAEWMAAGHCDYTEKYALYAAELAIGKTPTA